MQMNEPTEPPAFGPERNAALALLLYGTACICGDPACKAAIPYFTKDAPNYCGNDADCFALLAELYKSKFEIEICEGSQSTLPVVITLYHDTKKHYQMRRKQPA